MNDRPVFRSTEQAIHFSYMMEFLEVSRKSSMHFLIDLMQQRGERTPGVRSTIDFEGLTPLETRGQCVMVSAAVDHHLNQFEAAAIHARCGFQATRSNGVRLVRDYVSPHLSTQDSDAILAMCWSIYCDHIHRGGLSTRAIAEGFGLSQSTVSRDIRKVREVCESLTSRAIAALKAHFEQSGLVDYSR